MQGTRTGNWLTPSQAEHLINRLEVGTLKGRRDRAIANVGRREDRWCITDIRGKHGRIRTVPMPSWAKVAIDQRAASAAISRRAVFPRRQQG